MAATAAVRPHSLWWARQASGMCGGASTVICGEPRVAAECRCTEREFGWCARPTVRPGRTVHDERDHGDGSDTRPRGRRTSALPAGRDRPAGQDRPRRVRRTRRTGRRRWRSGPGHRRCAPPGLPARWRGGTAVGRGHPGRECDGHDSAGARGRGSWPTSPMIPTWPGWSTVSQPRMGSSHRVREKSPARRPRVVVEAPPSRGRHRRQLVGRTGAAWRTRIRLRDTT